MTKRLARFLTLVFSVLLLSWNVAFAQQGKEAETPGRIQNLKNVSPSSRKP